MNQKINIYNYEAFLLDHSEGRLTPEEEAELMLFLSKHPDLNFDPEGLQGAELEQELFIYLHKNELKKSEKDLVSEELLVGYLEGILDFEDKKWVDLSARHHSGIKKELDLYLKTIIQPDKEIVFDKKSQLKRKNKVITFSFSEYVRYGIAAAILLLVGLTFWWNSSIKPVNPLAKKESEKKNSSFDITHESVANITPTKNTTVKTKSFSKPQKKKTKQSYHSEKSTDTYIAQQNIKPELKQDTIIIEPKLEKNVLASQTPIVSEKKNNSVIIVSENSDEVLISQNNSSQKKSIWSLAGKALKNLNKVGVKTVDGEESEAAASKDYLLTFGSFSISHSQANQ